MSRMIFVNLPVENLDKSVDFFTQLGFTFNPQFTDESATCMILSDQAFVMLLVKDRFSDFTNKQIADTSTTTEAIFAISAESRDEVDEIVDKALAAGGQRSNDPMDEGFMYGWSFQDIDGHLWEVIWMDPSGPQS
ncbi:MAG: VOC family protein [Nocardioidaceae bacterium]|nr:VOC family protein [Nocardioidaceae bacterium]